MFLKILCLLLTLTSIVHSSLAFDDDVRCNFENDFCDWLSISSIEAFSFQRVTWKTLAENGVIGPKLPSYVFNEKEAENEFFLYLTPSNMVFEKTQQKAQIEHGLPNSSGCLKFWFDFNGNPGIDRFYVEIFPKGSNDETKIIWNLDKNWSHDDSVWTEAQVYLDSGEKVAFGAVLGTGYGNETGYVALDNIEWDFDATKESCIIQPPEAYLLMTNFETTEPPNGPDENSNCYRDNGTRIFNDRHVLENNSPDQCNQLCSDLGFSLYGVEYSNECFCGNDMPADDRKIDMSKCNMPCTGDASLMCGGNFAINIGEADKPTTSTVEPSTEPPDAIIFCSFDDDYCNWNRQPNEVNDVTYGWGRHNSKQLDTDGIPGPPSDANDNRDKTFIIASNMISVDAPADANGKILSPYLLGSQHREECLSFMFYFSPDTPDDALRVYKRVKDGKPERILIWQLFSSGFGGFGSQWIEGNVKILAEENEEYRIEFQSNKGVNEQGYVAVDDVSFIEIPKCDLKPKEADPTITTTTKKTTTTTPKKTTPTTTPVPSTEPPDAIIFCDFENDNYCHWNRNPGSVNATRYGWGRHTTKDLEASEIPSPAGDFADSKDGHYIIASNKISINAGKNAKGQFLSPFLIGSQHVEECLSFKVYFSPEADSLSIYKKIKDVSQKVDDKELIWQLSGSSAAEKSSWIQSHVKILAEDLDTYEYRIELVANRGDNQLGFIAIDEIIFLDGVNECNIEPKEAEPKTTTTTKATTTTTPKQTTPTTTPVPSTEPPDAIIFCDFENDNYCHWNRNPGSVNATRYGWERHTTKDLQASEIPSPAGDFANSKDGHYIIASNKISNSAGNNAKGQFLSPFLIGSQHVEECLTFKVYFSPEADSLRIYKKIKDVSYRDDDKDLLWDLSGSNVIEKSSWIQGQIKVLAEDLDTYEYRIELIANRGGNELGFIAIDEIIFLDGENECNILPKEADPTLTTTVKSTTTTTPKQTTPTTTPVPSTEPPDAIIFCDFENDNYCHWNRNPGSLNATRYGWGRHTTKDLEASDIPSPSGDFGDSKDGHYIIASNKISMDAKDDAKGLFLSPFLIGSQHVEECFTFQVYFSEDADVLRVYKKIKDVSNRDNDRELLWQLSSSNAVEKSNWFHGQIKILAEDSDTYEYRIEFEANKGGDLNSFIAIDQVIFLDGENQCDILPKEADPTLTTTTTTTTPSTTPVPSTEPPDAIIFCNFETDGYCHWNRNPSFVNASRYGWGRFSSKDLESTDIPCPTEDFSNGKNGHYIMVSNKLSINAADNANAQFLSPFLIGSQHVEECFTFKVYFAPEVYSGVLKIYKKIKDVSDRDNDRQLIWELTSSNHVEEGWIDGQVKIMAEDSDTYEYRIEFQADKGGADYGFMAIDEVVFVNEENQCDTLPERADPTYTTTTTTPKQTTPTTTPVPSTEPPDAIIFCDFESENYCHWNRNPNSVNATRFGWKKFTSNELGDIPGPPADLSNNKDGHYILASNKIAINAGENAKAKFLSPYLIGKQHVEECFQFLVYLSPAADVLRVYKKIKDVAERVLLWELTASFAGDQPKWFEGQVKILAEETDGYEYRIEFEVNRGNNELGFVALDDVTFIEVPKCDIQPKEADPSLTTTTKTTPKTTTPVPSTEPPDAIIYCTFDKDYCHWDRNPRNINATQYGFDRHTPSDLESSNIPGPPYDAFESKDGTFVIASNMISKDAAKNAIGKLFSPYLLGTQHPVECFSFYVYFSAESNDDRLRIYKRIRNNTDRVLMWDLSSSYIGNEPKWIEGQIKVMGEEVEGYEYRIEFQANKGGNQNGYIAIDDVSFIEEDHCDIKPKQADPSLTTTTKTTPTTSTPEPSTEPPNSIIFCPFENDYCSWNRYPKTVNKTMYGWLRYNSKQLNEQNIPGPPTDPLEGDEGFYVLASDYISSDVETGTNGRIASPYILGKDHPEVCFSFMVYFGPGQPRNFQVLQRIKGIDALILLWDLPTTFKPNSWFEGRLPVNAASSEEYRLVFRAFKGDGTEGFIAIDDATIMETSEDCHLSPPEAKPVTTTTSTTPTTTFTSTPVPSTEPPNSIIFCSFEKDFCHWNRYPGGANKTMYGWKRYNSKQLTNQNIPGPPSDPLEGDEGIYALASDYISSDVKTGTGGRIASPYILGKDHPEVCFSFMVYFGPGPQRKFQVKQRIKGVDGFFVLWELPNTYKTNSWFEGRIPVSAASTEEYRLEFQGFKGDGTEGFIAIDDATILETPEACQLSPPEAKPVTTTTSTTPTTKPPNEDIICTFESGTCDWKITSYGPNEDFKWDLTNGESLSNSETAGPEFDYNNNKEAIFLIAHDNKKEYFATANITSHNEKAEEIFTMLVSPQYSAKDHPLECFQFWYFYGPDDSSYTLTISLTHNEEPEPEIVWHLADTQVQEPKWYQARMELRPRDGDASYFIVEVMARRGETPSYIAIDQFEFFRGQDICDFEPKEAIPDPNTTPAPNPSQAMDCGFQSGPCKYNWDSELLEDTFYWNRTNGEILSQNGLEGPKKDHLEEVNGYFLYTSGGYSEKEYAHASIYGPFVTGSTFGHNCMQFQFYYQPKSGLKDMTIYMEEEQGERIKLWQLTNPLEDKWNFGQFLLDHKTNFRLLIEVTKSNGQDGFAAFDDILASIDMIEECEILPPEAVPVTTTPTPSGPLDCDFQESSCSWTIENGLDEFVFYWNRTNGELLLDNSLQGPETDHKGDAKGYFVYSSATFGMNPGAYSDILSEYFTEGLQTCLTFSFWFEPGQTFDRLTISKDEDEGRTVIWDVYDEFKGWTQGQVQIDAPSKLMLIVEVQKTNWNEEPSGFVAIDDFIQVNSDQNCDILPAKANPTTPPESWNDCNFQNGLCGWELSGAINDDMFAWNRTNGKLLGDNGLEGPTFDHTQNENGFFLYTNSAFGKKDGAIAAFVSPFIENVEVCLRFFFWFEPGDHAFTTLVFYVEDVDGQRDTIWKLTTRDVNDWEEGQIPLNFGYDYNIIVEIVKGPGGSKDVGYALIDDFTHTTNLEECGVFPPEADPMATTTQKSTTTTHHTEWHECDFEREDLCGWIIEPSPPEEPFNFERMNARLLEEQGIEGPQSDHNEEKDKYFIYANAAKDHEDDQAAIMVSPLISDMPDFCFHFYFQIKPREGIKALQVFKVNDKSNEEILLWSLLDDYYDHWEFGQVHVQNPDHPFRLIIKTIRNGNSEGYTAVDDFAIETYPEKCQIIPEGATPPNPPPKNQCDFQDDLCGWVHRDAVFTFNRTSGQILSDSGIEGPLTDHTQSKDKYFMLADASYATEEFMIAALESPEYGSEDGGSEVYCFKFFYNFYPDGGIRQLSINLLLDAEEPLPVWQVRNQYYWTWDFAQFPIELPVDSDSTKFKLLIIAERGDNDVGWAGFDDYELIPDQDNCKLRPPEAVPHEPETGDCYFQHSNCGWEIVQHGEEENNFQFVRTNANESVIQGPKYDHFGDPYGKFVIAYGELQSPEGTLAELRSPMFENVPSQCFHFHFTFKALNGVKSMSIFKQVENSEDQVEVWTLSTNDFDEWEEGKVFIEESRNYQLVVKVIKGNEQAGWAGLDDFEFDHEQTFDYCPTMPENAAPSTTPSTPHTTPTTTPKLITECDFQTDLCGWKHRDSANFHFNRTTGQALTDQGIEGPNVDHTNSKDQYFMVAIASYSSEEFNIASIESPQFGSASEYCFQFYYNFHPDGGIRQLSIDMIPVGEGGVVSLWQVRNQHYWTWDYAQVKVKTDQSFVFLITAERGDNSVGWAGFDDYKLLLDTGFGDCEIRPPEAVPHKPAEGDCNFQHSTCDWEIVQPPEGEEENFKFHRTNSNESMATGPPTDHFGDPYGFYLMAYGSLGMHENAQAIVKSSIFPGFDSDQCFHFHWSFNAGKSGIKSMTISRKIIDQNEVVDLWRLESNDFDEWEYGSIPIPSIKDSFEIFVTVVRGNDPSGWAGVDDFEFHHEEESCTLEPPNAAPPPPSTTEPPPPDDTCTFQTDFCNWQSESDNDFKWTRKTGADFQSCEECHGPDADFEGSEIDFFINVDAKDTDKENTAAELKSPLIQVSEHASICLQFFFELHVENRAISELHIEVLDEHAATKKVWKIVNPVTEIDDNWHDGQVWIEALEPNINYWIIFRALRGDSKDGYAAMDNIVFSKEITEAKNCEVKPAFAAPASCDVGQFECPSDHSCINITQVCDFWDDCPEGDDEKSCPKTYLFEDCQEEPPPGCGWVEQPEDELDWIIAADNDSNTNIHGPYAGGDKFLYLLGRLGPSEEYSHDIGRVASPMYTQSSAECRLDIYFFVNGTTGQCEGTNDPAALVIALNEGEEEIDMPLDYIYTQTSNWQQRKIQIGRRSNEFKVVIKKESSKVYDAGMAIDDVSFISCPLRRPTEGDCPNEEYKCQNKVCISNDRLCDLADDCGDNSDESLQLCEARSSSQSSEDETYFRDTFEEENESFFHNANNQETNWVRGSGDQLLKARSPAFDHTLFSDHGHYMRMDVKSGEEKIVKSSLMSDLIEPGEEECRMRFYYHFTFETDHPRENSTSNPRIISAIRLSVRTESGNDSIIWEVTEDSGNLWNREDIAISVHPSKSENYMAVFTGEYQQQTDYIPYGDIAIDDVSFTPKCSFHEGPTPPTSTSTTPTPPDECLDDEYQCRSPDASTPGKCIKKTKVCNFIDDCPEMDDEETCPPEFTFDICDTLEDCHWYEETPGDDLNFNIMKVQDLIDGGLVQKHGPLTDPINSTEGRIAIILSQDPDNPNEDQDIASMSSPTYRDSYVKCQFEFWYYLAGNVGDAIFMPVLIHGSSDQGHTSYLDVFKPDSPKMGAWHRSVTGIGRQLGDFKMGFVLTPTDTYDAGVAIDDVAFMQCAPDYPEEKCPEGFFHCLETKICIPNAEICDLTDQCGDNSDEQQGGCAEAKKDTFESDDNPFGLFTQYAEQSDFKWERGNGDRKIPGTYGPPFDHTTFGPVGHYLYIRATDHNIEEQAQLITKPFKGNQDQLLDGSFRQTLPPCKMSIWIYVYGPHVGVLHIYLTGEDGAQLELDVIDESLENMWYHWVITMPNRTDPYQVAIEAAVTHAEQGDLAIDDVVFDENCVYYDGPYGPSTSPKTTKTTTKTTKTTTKTTKPTTQTTTTPNITPPSGGLSTTAIIVVVFGCILAVGLFGLAACYWAKKKQSGVSVSRMFSGGRIKFPGGISNSNYGSEPISLRDLSSSDRSGYNGP